MATEGLPVGAEPGADASADADFGGVVVAAAVGQEIGVTGVGDLGVAVERGQARDDVVAAGAAAAGDLGAAVVDQLAGGVAARVEPGGVAIALAQCVLDVLLIRGMFERGQLAGPGLAGFRQTAQRRVGVRFGDAVTEMADIVAVQPDPVGVLGGQAQVLTQVPGEVGGRGADRPRSARESAGVVDRGVQVGVSGIVDELDLDPEPITPRQPLVRRHDIGCGGPGGLGELPHLCVRYPGALVQIHADHQVRDRVAGLVDRTPYLVGQLWAGESVRPLRCRLPVRT
nr:hypothetical protein [Nocardia transvalensis]